MRKRSLDAWSPTPSSHTGELITLEHSSKVLADNPLGDPTDRTFHVWLPPGYKPASRRAVSVLYDLTGYTGSGFSHTNWKNFEENVPEMLDRLSAEGRLSHTIVVFPDCFTSLGGNQYINSSAIGRYADYLTRELVPFVDQALQTHGERDRRGCFGKSSGGYGAMVHGMLYADTWGAVANHSGDAYFDFVYRAEWPAALTELGKHVGKARKPGRTRVTRASDLERGLDDGRIHAFLEHFWSKRSPSGAEVMTLMMVCMAATYDPDRRAPLGFRVPFNLETGEIIETRWRKWLAHDPIHMVKAHRANLKSLRGVFVDCGWFDQFHIHFGSRQLSAALTRHGIKHRYEEFADNHSGIDYRMEISLPFLSRALR